MPFSANFTRKITGAKERLKEELNSDAHLDDFRISPPNDEITYITRECSTEKAIVESTLRKFAGIRC